METNNSEIYSRPLEAFPVLMEASAEQRNVFTIGKDKTDVRWKKLDEDIPIDSFFSAEEPDYENSVANVSNQSEN